MDNLTAQFTDDYRPVKSIIVYACGEPAEKTYVESFDFSEEGRMINAHPLSIDESRNLAEILNYEERENSNWLQCNGLLPANILHINTGKEGFVIWHTPAVRKNLFFISGLSVRDGKYPLPSLVWIADKQKLSVFALRSDDKPDLKTELYNAPFFNVHSNGVVCMGTVDIDFSGSGSLEKFIENWQGYFFNSKFSHLIIDKSPVKSNIIQLYKQLTGKRNFPVSQLLKANLKIKNILNGHR